MVTLSYGQPVFNPVVPFMYGFPGPIPDYGMFVMEGFVPAESQGFALNFQIGPSVNPRDDVALHLGFNFASGSNLLVNTIRSRQWEAPVNFPSCPIRKMEPFQVMILTQRRSFMIALNGQHYCEFSHRRNPDEIRFVAVDGIVSVSRIQLEFPGGLQHQSTHQLYSGPGFGHPVSTSNNFSTGAAALGAIGAMGAMAAPFFYPGKQKKMKKKGMKHMMHGGHGVIGFPGAGHSFGSHGHDHGHSGIGGLIAPAVGVGLGTAALGYGLRKMKHKKHGGHGWSHSGHKSSSSSSSSSDSD